MYKKVLVCLDGSELAEQGLPYAAELAKRFDSALVLLRVVPDPVMMTPGIPGVGAVPVVTSRMGRQAETEERDAETYLGSVAALLSKDFGLNPEYTTSLGSAGPVIVEYATANEVELIAIATHGRTGPGRVLFGSVADYVLRHSRVPLMVCRCGLEA